MTMKKKDVGTEIKFKGVDGEESGINVNVEGFEMNDEEVGCQVSAMKIAWNSGEEEEKEGEEEEEEEEEKEEGGGREKKKKGKEREE